MLFQRKVNIIKERKFLFFKEREMVETLKNEVDNSERFQEDIGKELALKGWKEMQKAFNNAEQELNNADINANYPKLFE